MRTARPLLDDHLVNIAEIGDRNAGRHALGDPGEGAPHGRVGLGDHDRPAAVSTLPHRDIQRDLPQARGQAEEALLEEKLRLKRRMAEP